MKSHDLLAVVKDNSPTSEVLCCDYYYYVDGKRVTKERYRTLNAMAVCFYNVSTEVKGQFTRQRKTIRVSD